jgi:transposase-like zinc ribbon protein
MENKARNLADLAQRFSDEEKARTFLEKQRWPEGPICPHCGVLGEATKLEPKAKGKTHAR